MANHASRPTDASQRVAGRSTHGKAARGPQTALQPLLTAEQTEGVIMRMAAVLSADVAKSPAARKEHIAHITGALVLAASLGVLPDARAIAVRAACVAILDSAVRPANGTPADPAFAAMVSTVRTNGGASVGSPLAMAMLQRRQADEMIGRLMAAGIIGGPDPSGFHPIVAGEC